MSKTRDQQLRKALHLGNLNRERLRRMEFPASESQIAWILANIGPFARTDFLYRFTNLGQFFPRRKCLDPIYTIRNLADKFCTAAGCSAVIGPDINGKSLCKSCYMTWQSNRPETKKRKAETCARRYGGEGRGSVSTNKKIMLTIKRNFGPAGLSSKKFTQLKVAGLKRLYGDKLLGHPDVRDKAERTRNLHKNDPVWVENLRAKQSAAQAKFKDSPLYADSVERRRASFRKGLRSPGVREARRARWAETMESLHGTDWRTKAMERLRSARYKRYEVKFRKLRWVCQGYERFVIPELISKGVNPKGITVELDYFEYDSGDCSRYYFPDIFTDEEIIEVKAAYTAGLTKGSNLTTWNNLQEKSRAVSESGEILTLYVVNPEKGYTKILEPHLVTRKEAMKLLLNPEPFTWKNTIGSHISLSVV